MKKVAANCLQEHEEFIANTNTDARRRMLGLNTHRNHLTDDAQRVRLVELDRDRHSSANDVRICGLRRRRSASSSIGAFLDEPFTEVALCALDSLHWRCNGDVDGWGRVFYSVGVNDLDEFFCGRS